jgi:hypothetical protein
MSDPIASISRKNRLRLFPRRGARTWFDRGFQSKASCLAWIREEAEKRGLDWQVGFMVKFKGCELIEFVDKLQRVPKSR